MNIDDYSVKELEEAIKRKKASSLIKTWLSIKEDVVPDGLSPALQSNLDFFEIILKNIASAQEDPKLWLASEWCWELLPNQNIGYGEKTGSGLLDKTSRWNGIDW